MIEGLMARWCATTCSTIFILVDGLIIERHRKLDSVGMGGLSPGFRATAKSSHPNGKLAASLRGRSDLNVEINKEPNRVGAYLHTFGLPFVSVKDSYSNTIRIILLRVHRKTNDQTLGLIM